MDSFFTKQETQSASRPDGKVYSCAGCGRYKDSHNARMQEYGKGKKGILVISGSPSKLDDKRGMPWQDKEGRAFQHTLKDCGIDLFEDCICIHSVLCYSDENVTNTQLTSCYINKISKLIKRLSPVMIITVGDLALRSIIGQRWKGDLGKVDKWRGWIVPDQEYKCWIAPIYHPADIDVSKPEVMTVWKQDIKNAVQAVDTKFPVLKVPTIHYLEDLSVLRDVKASQMTFDYETTGLKPHALGHRILCASVAFNKEEVYVFEIPKKRVDLQPFLDLLTNWNIGKMAHNMKFEDTWTKIRLRVDVGGWDWDSMLAAHIMDNRTGVTGLKFQTYVNFGVVDYASEVGPWLKSKDKGGNAINRLQEYMESSSSKRKVLTYCALDSHYQFLLAMKQIKLIDYDFLPF